MEKKCCKCDAVLIEGSCAPSRFTHGGPCRSCRNKERRNRYKNEPEFRKKDSDKAKRRRSNMSSEDKRRQADMTFFYKYGVSVVDFNDRLKAQNNKCAICSVELSASVDNKSPIRACQDHDHKSRKLRDILCNRCNLLLGYSDDNIEILQKAIAYLQKHAVDGTFKINGVEAA